MIGVVIKGPGSVFNIVNVYCHADLKARDISTATLSFFRKNEINVLGGDFNFTKEENSFEIIENACSKMCMEQLQWNEPTHFKGRCIDHIFLLSDLPEDWKFITGVPAEFLDHIFLVGGATCKLWDLKHFKKQIPTFLTKDPSFIKEVIAQMGKYNGSNPLEFLERLKSQAKTIASRWMDKSENKEHFSLLWRHQVFIKRIRRMRFYRKSSVSRPYSSYELDIITEAGINFKKPKKRSWGEAIVPRMIQVVNNHIEVLEKKLGIFSDDSLKIKKKKGVKIKGLIVDGVISNNTKKISEAISNFGETSWDPSGPLILGN